MKKQIMRQKIIKQILILISFILLAFISVILLFQSKNLFGAYDLQFHMKRINELMMSVHHGNFLPYFSFNEFHGSAVMTLYPYIWLLPYIVIFKFFKSYVLSTYIYIILLNFMGLLVSYYGSLKISRSKLISYFFSICYMFSIPLLSYEFSSMDIGASLAIIFLPLPIFGILKLIKYDNWLQLSVGVIFIAFSHILSLSIVIAFITICVLINIKVITKKKILNLIKASILSILITSVIWVQASIFIFHNLGNIYPVQCPPYLTGINLKNIIKAIFSVNSVYSLGLTSFIGLILSIIFYKKLDRYLKQMFYLSVFIIFVGSNLFPWKLKVLKVFRIYQYTYRFYIIPQLLLTYMMVYIILKYFLNNNWHKILLLFITILIIFLQLFSQNIIKGRNITSDSFTNSFVSKNMCNKHFIIYHKRLFVHLFSESSKRHDQVSFPLYKINTNNQMRNSINVPDNYVDYSPISSIKVINSVNNNKGIYGHNKYILVKHINFNEYKFNNLKNIHKLCLPMFYYNGEHLNIYLDNHKINGHKNKYNLITINDINHGSHKLYVNYVLSRKVRLIIFVLLAIGLCLISAVLYKATLEKKHGMKIN